MTSVLPSSPIQLDNKRTPKSEKHGDDIDFDEFLCTIILTIFTLGMYLFLLPEPTQPETEVHKDLTSRNNKRRSKKRRSKKRRSKKRRT